MTLKIARFAMVVALIAGGCSSGKIQGSASAGRDRADGAAAGTVSSVPSPARSTASGSPTAVASGFEPGAKTASERKCALRRVSRSPSGVPGPWAYIVADPNPFGWGNKCLRFRPGAYCIASFSGQYGAPGDEVYPQFQVWLPKAKKPWLARTIGPFPGGSGDFRDWDFGFTVPDTSAVLMRMVLLDANKREIANADSWAREVCGRT